MARENQWNHCCWHALMLRSVCSWLEINYEKNLMFANILGLMSLQSKFQENLNHKRIETDSISIK